MPSPGAPAPLRLPIEDSYFELLADTLESLDLPARGQFLQRYIRAITHLDLRETQCIQLWDEMLSRRRELSENLRRPVALKTALMAVLASAGLFRVPIVIEYEELKPLQLTVGVSMDHGVATFPQDGEQAEQLIRVADERLYRLKHANHGKSGNGGSRTPSESVRAEQASSSDRAATPSAPISIESGRT